MLKRGAAGPGAIVECRQQSHPLERGAISVDCDVPSRISPGLRNRSSPAQPQLPGWRALIGRLQLGIGCDPEEIVYTPTVAPGSQLTARGCASRRAVQLDSARAVCSGLAKSQELFQSWWFVRKPKHPVSWSATGRKPAGQTFVNPPGTGHTTLGWRPSAFSGRPWPPRGKGMFQPCSAISGA
jgi:hypothetical protein